MGFEIILLLIVAIGGGWYTFQQVNNSYNRQSLNPESKWKVALSNDIIETTNYEGDKRRINISDIKQITLETNDSGPFGTDLWWIIDVGKDQVTVPQGATGEKELLDRLQKIEGFDNNQLIQAMSSTKIEKFILYNKTVPKAHARRNSL